MKNRNFSDLAFATLPSWIRARLNIVHSVYESRGNSWGKGVVDKCKLVRRGGHETYDSNELPFNGGRKEVSYPMRFVYAVKNAVVSLRRGRICAGGRWLGESFGNPYGAASEVFCYKFFSWCTKLFCRTVHLPPNDNGYIFCRYDGYFHFVVESMVTLLYSLKVHPNTSVIVRKKDYENSRYFRDYIDILKKQSKIRNLQIVDADFAAADKLAFAAYEPDAGMICKESVGLLVETFGKELAIEGKRRVFLTRKGRRRFDNQEEIEQTLAMSGFDVIDAESLSVREQMDIFRASSFIVSNHGAGLTNILWSRSGTVVVELFSHKWLNDCYFRLASIKGLRYRSLVAKESNGWGIIDCQKLRKIIEVENV
jgi:hypothetical protein